MKKIILMFLLLTFIFSCKGKKVIDKNLVESTKLVKENIYRISVFGVFSEENRVTIWYTEDSELKFNSKHFLTQKIKASSATQEVKFELKKDEILNKFRIRLAKDKTIKKVELDSIVITYNKEKIIVNPTNFFRYLKANKYVSFDSISPEINFYEKEINNIKIFDPFIISSPELNKLMFDL